MTDANKIVADATTTAPEGVESSQVDGATPPAEPLGEGGRKALDAERKARRDAEDKLKALQTRLDEIEGEAAAADLRREVAEAKGLTPRQAARLTGDTREALEADADDLLDAFTPSGATPPPTLKPQPDLRGGNDPNSVVPDAAQIAEQVLGTG